MSEPTVGRLDWEKKKKGLAFTLVRTDGDKEKRQPVQNSALIEPPLRAPTTSSGQLEVECSLEKGQVQWVRSRGSQWTGKSLPHRPKTPHASTAPTMPLPPSDPSRKSTRPSLARVSPEAKSPTPEGHRIERPPGQFHNPYNFIPAPPRDDFRSGLADEDPRPAGGLHRLHPHRWTGKLAVTLETKTPLLIPDANFLSRTAAPNRSDPRWDRLGISDTDFGNLDKDHKFYGIRRDAVGNPYLPPTSVKGMLRAAYEAITASRMAVLDRHEKPLAFRLPTTVGTQVVPVRVESVGADTVTLQFLPGKSSISELGGRPMYAAWLPFKQKKPSDPPPPSYDGMKHGDAVVVRLKTKNAALIVQDICSTERRTLGTEADIYEGYLCITGKNIENKSHERIFFSTPENLRKYPIHVMAGNEAQRISTQWHDLIRDYKRTHQKELDKNNPGPSEMEGCEWSRHIKCADEELDLKAGMLCYAAVSLEDGQIRVEALYPVSISRALHERAPIELIHPSLRPAADYSQFSPADRVFGWVNQGGPGAWRGRLRVGPTSCKTPNAIESFEREGGVPLAILGQPKPQQGGFYLAGDQAGRFPLPDGTTKGESYTLAQATRGRKVYPHHAGLPSDHWDEPWRDRTQNQSSGRHQEYRRPVPKTKDKGQSDRDDQNRTMLEWVKPQTEFHFDLHVENLTEVELGALLWLLELKEDQFFRLGGGKPLGFGSVKLRIRWLDSQLASGERWQQIWGTLDDEVFQTEAEIRASIRAFKDAVEASSGASGAEEKFEQVSWIKAFNAAARGPHKPIHYPRLKPAPNPDGKSYEWFVENEGQAKDGGGLHLSLSSLEDDLGLPYVPTKFSTKSSVIAEG